MISPAGRRNARSRGGTMSSNKNHIRTTKSKQVSFKVEAAIGQYIEAVSRSEDLPLADFVRKVFLWGLGQFEAVGSMRALRLMALPDELIEKTRKKEREAFHQQIARLKKKSLS
jgi:hypothetical protein